MGWSMKHQNLDREIMVEWDTEGNVETAEAGVEQKHHPAVEKMVMEE
jgi:hypothetical protein